jgi:hypothetical protein
VTIAAVGYGTFIIARNLSIFFFNAIAANAFFLRAASAAAAAAAAAGDNGSANFSIVVPHGKKYKIVVSPTIKTNATINKLTKSFAILISPNLFL